MWIGSAPFSKGINPEGNLIDLDYEDYKQFSGQIVETDIDLQVNISDFGEELGISPYSTSWFVNVSSMPSSLGEWIGGYVNITGLIYNSSEHGNDILLHPYNYYFHMLSSYLGHSYGFLGVTDTSILVRLLDIVFIPPTQYDKIFGNLILKGPICLEKRWSFEDQFQFLYVGTTDLVNVIIDNKSLTYAFPDISLVTNSSNIVSIDSITFINQGASTTPSVFNFDEPNSLDFKQNFVPISGGFDYDNGDENYVLKWRNNLSQPYSAALLDTQSYGDSVIQFEMGVYPTGDETHIGGIMLNIPVINSSSLFFDSLFIGFKMVGGGDLTFPLSLFVARYYSPTSYTVLYEKEITKLGNSFGGNNDILAPLKLTIIKTVTSTGLKLSIYSKVYRVYPYYGADELLEIQIENDGIYNCKTAWFGQDYSFDYDMRGTGKIGIFTTSTSFTFHHLSVYTLMDYG
ncbi:MAG: hypothetical protein ACTSSM_16605 [Promethearchaeota archaeon]